MDWRKILTSGAKAAKEVVESPKVADDLIMPPESEALYKNAMDADSMFGKAPDMDKFVADQADLLKRNEEFLEGQSVTVPPSPQDAKMSTFQKMLLGGAGVAGAGGLYGLSQMGGEAPASPAGKGEGALLPQRTVDDDIYQNFSGIGTDANPKVNKFIPTDDAATATSNLSRQIASSNPGPAPSVQSAVAPGVPPSALSEGFTENTVENLRAAQEQARGAKFVNDIGRAGAFLNAGIGGTDVNKGAVDVLTQQGKDSGQIVDDFEKRAEKEKSDPKSQISAQFRDYVKQFGISLPSNTSAEAAAKIMPYAYQKFAAKEAQTARAEEGRLSRANAKDMKEATIRAAEIAAGAKKESKLNDDQASYSQKLAKDVQNKEFEKFNKIDNVVKRMKRSVANPTAQGDASLVYDFVKALDNESAVKEGEIQFVGAAASLDQRVKNMINKAYKGTMLTPEQRQEILNIGLGSRDDQKKTWEISAAPALKRADKLGIDHSLILPDYGDEEAPAEAPKAPQSEMVAVISPSGKPGSIPKANLEKALSQGYKVK